MSDDVFFSPYGQWFYAEHLDADHAVAYRHIADLIWGMFQPTSIVDVGCGTGNLLVELQQRGAQSIVGIEAPQRMTEITSCAVLPVSSYRWLDLRYPFSSSDPIPRGDLCISVEVAEHLPEQSADEYIRYLTQCSDTLVFSAAYPGQTGHGHINEREHGWWDDLLRAHGFAEDSAATGQLQQGLRGNVASCFWYENLYVFRANHV